MISLHTAIQNWTPFLASVAAILAWSSKLIWAKEYKNAKEEQIRAVNMKFLAFKENFESQERVHKDKLDILNERINFYEDIISDKVRNQFKIVKEQLEAINNELEIQVKDLNLALRDKEELISVRAHELKVLKTNNTAIIKKLSDLEAEKINLEYKLNNLTETQSQVINASQEIKKIDSSTIQRDSTSHLISVSKTVEKKLFFDSVSESPILESYKKSLEDYLKSYQILCSQMD